GAQPAKEPRSERLGRLARRRRGLEPQARAELLLLDGEEKPERDITRAREPQAAQQAPHRLVAADRHVRVHRRTEGDGLIAFLEEVGKAELAEFVAQPRAAEAMPRMLGYEPRDLELHVGPRPARE